MGKWLNLPLRLTWSDAERLLGLHSEIFPLTELEQLCMCVLVAQSYPTACNPVDCSSPGSSVRGILQAGLLEWVAIPFSRGSPNPGIKPWSSALQADSLPSEPPGKPGNNYNSALNQGLGSDTPSLGGCKAPSVLWKCVLASLSLYLLGA